MLVLCASADPRHGMIAVYGWRCLEGYIFHERRWESGIGPLKSSPVQTWRFYCENNSLHNTNVKVLQMHSIKVFVCDFGWLLMLIHKCAHIFPPKNVKQWYYRLWEKEAVVCSGGYLVTKFKTDAEAVEEKGQHMRRNKHTFRHACIQQEQKYLILAKKPLFKHGNLFS